MRQTFRFAIATSLLLTLCTFAFAEAYNVPALFIVNNDWNRSQWREQKFKGSTEYSTVKIDERGALKAVTSNSASALYKKIAVDIKKTPYLNWAWKVENIYPIKNQLQKNGDDYPARIYVIVRDGLLPWRTLALNYVWSNVEPDTDWWPNPFTSNAAMIPVQSGTSGLGSWQHYKVNIRRDFKRIFKRDISTIDGIAIMADSDNSGGQATSYFGQISFTAK